MIQLGDQVVDSVSGFKGIVICISEYLQGCKRVGVQPKALKNGTLPDAHYFDEPQLSVIKKKAVKTPKSSKGGPAYAQPPQRRTR